jgi:hypothetical protein
MTYRNRAYFSYSLDQIKEEYNRNLNNLESLNKILHELSYRNTPQAKKFRIVVNKKISDFNTYVNTNVNANAFSTNKVIKPIVDDKQSVLNDISSIGRGEISSVELSNKLKQLEFQFQDFSKKTNNKLNLVLTLIVLISLIVAYYSINFI